MNKLKVNQEITAGQLLLIDEEGKSQGVVSLDQALYLAYEKGYDLVLVNENQKPPIAKLMDYGKYLYTLQKQTSKQKARTHGPELKEMRLGVKIDTHDLSVKINRIKKFLDRGDKVKVSIQLKGREMMFQEKVSKLLEKVRAESGAVFEGPIEKMRNRFSIVLVKNKKQQKDVNEIKNS